MLVKNLVLGLTCLVCLGVKAQNTDVINYVNTYREIAIREMQRSGVPASITLAQGIHESMAGKSDLTQRSNNHFGIKCKTNWQGEKVYHDDDAKGECFRSYVNAEESFTDHSDFLRNGQRYAFLFKLNPTDYKEWAYGLKKAGYATNKKYPELLIKLIEDYNLQQYTLIAMGEMDPLPEMLVSNKGPKAMEVIPAVAGNETIAVPHPEYPAGKFTLNNTPVVFSRSGTSLLVIAMEHKVTLARLLDFNDLGKEDILTQDQLVYLQRKRKVGAHEYHIVLPGETLYSISQAEGIRLESLLEYNHLGKEQLPAVGEKLYLRSAAPAAPALVQSGLLAANVITGTAVTHVVQAKETLFQIARRYNTTVDNIREWNKLDSNGLQIGQELVIYKN